MQDSCNFQFQMRPLCERGAPILVRPSRRPVHLRGSAATISAWPPSARITTVAGVGWHVDASLDRVTVDRAAELHLRGVAAVLRLRREADVVSAERAADRKGSGSPRIGDGTGQIISV